MNQYWWFSFCRAVDAFVYSGHWRVYCRESDWGTAAVSTCLSYVYIKMDYLACWLSLTWIFILNQNSLGLSVGIMYKPPNSEHVRRSSHGPLPGQELQRRESQGPLLYHPHFPSKGHFVKPGAWHCGVSCMLVGKSINYFMNAFKGSFFPLKICIAWNVANSTNRIADC